MLLNYGVPPWSMCKEFVRVSLIFCMHGSRWDGHVLEGSALIGSLYGHCLHQAPTQAGSWITNIILGVLEPISPANHTIQ